jgi:hypothetical protein
VLYSPLITGSENDHKDLPLHHYYNDDHPCQEGWIVFTYPGFAKFQTSPPKLRRAFFYPLPEERR